MFTFNMTFDQVEAVVADSVYAGYEKLDDVGRRRFCTGIANAHRHLLSEYDVPYIGEAYAWWYHMARTDNIGVALDKINEVHPLPATLKALDIGAGTGAGVMAIAYWMSQNHLSTLGKVGIRCIEPSAHMRETAQYIIPSFLEKLRASISPSIEGEPLGWGFHPTIQNLEMCAAGGENRVYDLVMFCYMFAPTDLSRIESMKSWIWDVAQRHLKQNGIMLFLTPKLTPKAKPDIVAKNEIMDQISTHLETNGMKVHAWHSLPTSSRKWRLVTDKRQDLIMEARRKINAECKLLRIVPAFDDSNPEYHEPYYSFSCRVDAFEFVQESQITSSAGNETIMTAEPSVGQ